MTKLYLRPVGIAVARDAATKNANKLGLPLCGTALAFTGAEIFERSGNTIQRHGLFSIEELQRRELTQVHGREQVAAWLTVLTRPRKSICGLPAERPQIMGIVNVTPDSFSDGGQLADSKAAIAHALRLEDAGASILDIGGESTRPGSDPVALDDELARVLPVIEGLAGRCQAKTSVDTRKAEVMRRAIEAGADMLNDVSALTYDPSSLEVVAQSGKPVILMHALGDPKTMQQDPKYDDVLLDIYDYLEARIAACRAAGVQPDRLIVDPGIGFGKTMEHNLTLLAGLSMFHGLGVQLMLGASRKRFIGALTGEQIANRRVAGSVAAALAGVAQGAQLIRVHDVAETRDALTVWQSIVEASR